MKPIRTPTSDVSYKLPGGDESNDLPVQRYEQDELGGTVLGSTWVPTDEERTRIALGANVELLVWGEGHPPVSIRVADYKVPDYRPPYTIQYPFDCERNQGGSDDDHPES